MSRTIKKKIASDYFDLVASGQKNFEVRLADWQCQEGDTLIVKLPFLWTLCLR